jgi:cytosine/adenosine deaminase-related metal-dependent hydrolase
VQTPGKYNLTMYQGASFDYSFAWKIDDVAVNLTGYSARMQVRRSHPSPTSVLTLTTENGGITLGGALGTIQVVADADVTAELDAAFYVYDIELESPSEEVYRLLEGKFTISPEVTRG